MALAIRAWKSRTSTTFTSGYPRMPLGPGTEEQLRTSASPVAATMREAGDIENKGLEVEGRSG